MQVKQLFKYWTYLFFAPGAHLRHKYSAFKSLLVHDATALELIADLEDVFYSKKKVDNQRVIWLIHRLSLAVEAMTGQLVEMNPLRYMNLAENFCRIDDRVKLAVDHDLPDSDPPYILSLDKAADFPDLAGGKGANLGRAFNEGSVNVPPGFVVTANAFNLFIDFNGLRDAIESRLSLMEVDNHSLLAKLTLEIQELILAADVPDEIADGISLAMSEMFSEEELIAVRSSALAEDGDISFAGQYASELSVQKKDVLEAYKRVLAGKFCPRAVFYRISNGLSDSETAMAVLILPMVEAEKAGVIYSKNPDSQFRSENICIYGVHGLGDSLVDGSISPAKAFLSRDPEPKLIRINSTKRDALPSEATLLELGRIAMRLESLFGFPQDIEWAKDSSGNVYILQTRPIQQNTDKAAEVHSPIENTPIVKGLERASLGVGCGEIYFAVTGKDFANIPEGAIVVTPTLKPVLSLFISKMNGVIAGTGSRASHFASVARECGLPVLVGDTLGRFSTGQFVTVDGGDGTVFDGCVEEVVTRNFKKEKIAQRVFDFSSKVAPFTVKLNLTNPESADFTAEGCCSLHDLVRFCHEKSVEEMFSLVDKMGRGMGAAKELKSELPLVMYILDLGKGLVSSVPKRGHITPQDIKSQPMRELWRGLASPMVKWSKGLTHIDWEEFDRVSAGIFSVNSKLLASYGIVSEDYLHLMIRFGYHFSVVDSICGPNAGANYINFRFRGGGSELENRLLRLEFIRRVLDHYGFKIEIHGDMLDAICSRISEKDTCVLLNILGYLLAVTRLMDMRLQNEKQVKAEVRLFIESAERLDGY
ncbi:PEP/pyruvate-binding domain-containing protein [Maridesulfovibrio ferrireducens]|uniref:PEP/pyruvate-binding domain-containing protein n=1 Tax=Maridesulfovibrio ferrireducens TaxID=246191 RepID=UPI001A1B2B87|nr:PEP/pyruvate-binding domain-containing protein [Maridesulfovibrio ferrireducens]MBI9109591.1 pyruvate, water dikinase [Maridesulfovibrio ferrireducens]